MTDTIFTKIINGDIPCHRVYEDDHVLAFLDVGPLSPGHTLVIPKEPAATLGEMSDESSAAIGRVLPRIARAVVEATGTQHYNILQNNGAPAHQAVFHVHFHIIPKPNSEQGLGVGWPSQKLDDARGADLAERMRAALAWLVWVRLEHVGQGSEHQGKIKRRTSLCDEVGKQSHRTYR